MKTILVLEDESSVLALMGCWLKDYRLLQATTAEQALQLFIDCGGRISLLVTDVRLTTRSGIQVALIFRSRRPRLPVVLISGYPELLWRDLDTDDLQRLGANSVVILEKPITGQTLSDAVRVLIGEPSPERVLRAQGL